MKSFISVFQLSEPKSRSCLCSLFIVASVVCGVYFAGNAFLGNDFAVPSISLGLRKEVNYTEDSALSDRCKGKCRPLGSEALPEGIIMHTSNLQMRPLLGPVAESTKPKHAVSLLAIAVGLKQKHLVNQMVVKFLRDDFAVMLFHYDGNVDGWNDLRWSERVIHVSARNQTKWWFAKRFLHPDIVADYEFIFLWDEDLGVENLSPKRYISIIKEEGLEISQPALDASKSEVHHQITARRRKSKVHRRLYKFKGGGRCYGNSTAPPCVGWVEMMAPVFSRAAWRCAWYMIQNDLIHAWGLDVQLGYCSQGDRAIKVGIVDAEYIIHLGLPTLGGFEDANKSIHGSADQAADEKNSKNLTTSATPSFNRSEVRRQSYTEMLEFKSRWTKAVKEDQCWVDPYQQSGKS